MIHVWQYDTKMILSHLEQCNIWPMLEGHVTLFISMQVDCYIPREYVQKNSPFRSHRRVHCLLSQQSQKLRGQRRPESGRGCGLGYWTVVECWRDKKEEVGQEIWHLTLWLDLGWCSTVSAGQQWIKLCFQVHHSPWKIGNATLLLPMTMVW